MPVPRVIISAEWVPRAAPYVHSADGRAVGVVVEHHRDAPALLQARPDRLPAPGQVRGEHHPLARLVDEARRGHPDGRDRSAAGHVEHRLDQRVLDHRGVDEPSGRRPARGRAPPRPSPVDDAGQHLGAADVDADAEPASTPPAQRRARSAAPMMPARLPSRAVRISWHRAVLASDHLAQEGRPRRRRAAGRRPRSPHRRSPSTAGSSTVASDAMPSPSHRPSSASSSTQKGSPSLAAAGDHRTGDRRGVAAGPLQQRPRLGAIRRRPAAGRRGPERCRWRTARSSRGCRSRRGDRPAPSGGGRPRRRRRRPPRNSWPSMTIPPPTPVPTVSSSRSSTSAPAPNANSPQAAALASFSTTTGRPSAASRSARNGTSRQRQVGSEHHHRAAGVDVAGHADPDRVDLVLGAQPLDQRDDGLLDPRRGRRPVTPRALRPGSCPAASTTPPAILVPPTSMPMLRLMAAAPPASRRRPAIRSTRVLLRGGRRRLQRQTSTPAPGRRLRRPGACGPPARCRARTWTAWQIGQ